MKQDLSPSRKVSGEATEEIFNGQDHLGRRNDEIHGAIDRGESLRVRRVHGCRRRKAIGVPYRVRSTRCRIFPVAVRGFVPE